MTALDVMTTPHTVRLTVRDFLVLNDHGAFDAYAKSELIDGKIVCVNAQHSPHGMAQADLVIALGAGLKKMGSPLRVTVEVSIQLDDHNLPEPDLIVTSYRGEGVVPWDQVMIVVEVSDSTLLNDLGAKATLYATHGVPEYWVLDVRGKALHQHWQPGDGRYAERRAVPLGGTMEAKAVPGLVVDLGEIG
jgi:Uma2 family endonuclease